jgi:hypothetical protein
MGKSHYWWWQPVKACIKEYPILKAKLKALQQQAITTTTTLDIATTSNGTGNGTGRPAERAALQQLPPREQEILDAVEAAISETMHLPDGAERLKIIDMVFWRQCYTIDGIALECHLSPRSISRRLSAFVVLVSKKMELT